MICPCCGTEFGYTDFNTSHEELRKKWLRAGAHWHSTTFPPPPGWNFYDQLKRAGHLADLYEVTGQGTTNKQVANE
jgi:hypothetical protein